MVQVDPLFAHTVYIALGTNLGDRLQNLQFAISQMIPALHIEHLSPIYETIPWGYLEQPEYLNQVIKATTYLSPLKLLRYLKHIETQMGRQVSVKNGPRLIDLDILFYDDLILDSPRLTIPHPRMQGRAFMLVPLADIEPGLIHPILKKMAIELSKETDRTGILKVAGGGKNMIQEDDLKPLKWIPTANVGYSVVRRADGGMQYTFTDCLRPTLEHWRGFALQHLIDSDRLTRNLYDLQRVDTLTQEAIEYALEVSNDPSARNIRLAVVVANNAVREAVEKIAALTPPGGLNFGIFTDLQEAEAWLDRPLTLMV